jgi:hypothetical protein
MGSELAKGFDDADPIEPTDIHHSVDDIIIDGRIEQSYNFIDYGFEGPGGRIRARTYLDTAHAVAIYPPVKVVSGQPPLIGEDWNTRDAVIRYLSRRFLVIKELGLEGYGVVWMACHAHRYLEHTGLSADD